MVLSVLFLIFAVVIALALAYVPMRLLLWQMARNVKAFIKRQREAAARGTRYTRPEKSDYLARPVRSPSSASGRGLSACLHPSRPRVPSGRSAPTSAIPSSPEGWRCALGIDGARVADPLLGEERLHAASPLVDAHADHLQPRAAYWSASTGETAFSLRHARHQVRPDVEKTTLPCSRRGRTASVQPLRRVRRHDVADLGSTTVRGSTFFAFFATRGCAGVPASRLLTAASTRAARTSVVSFLTIAVSRL